MTGKNVPHSNDHNDAFASIQEDALLKALQGFITSHIQKRPEPRENDSIVFGHEAMKLVEALKNFTSNIVKDVLSQTGRNSTVVRLQKSRQPHHKDTGDAENLTWALTPSLHHENTVSNGISEAVLRHHTTFHTKLLRRLRQHVFNRMPIRLLCFTPSESILQISLIDRVSVYTYLEATALEKFHERDSEYFPKFDGERRMIESDDDAVDRFISMHAGYAILSHTWLRDAPGEVTFSNWNKNLFSSADPGYQKLVNFCQTAWREHGLTLGWMDTVCIDKESSSELDESIRSMYNWYERAQVCIVYLAETERISDMHTDSWFTRGWTLQELLAPSIIKFYNRAWDQFQTFDNDKGFFPQEIPDQIEKATTITWIELHDIREVPFSRRMQLAAIREVTREEDTAYSLMGIFGVSIATAYREGSERAFYRLLQEILNSTSGGILDIFNWAGHVSSNISYILPSSPLCYVNRSSSISLDDIRPLEPITLTHMGLRIPVLLMSGVPVDNENSDFHPIGKYTATVHISPIGNSEWIPTTYRLLDQRIALESNGYRYHAWPQYTFAVVNIQQDTMGIFIPQTCIAIALECYEDVGKMTSMGVFYRIETKEPIIFDMEDREGHKVGDDGIDIEIPVEELREHGMQLISIYL